MISLKELVLKAYPDHPDASSLPEFPLEGIECDSRKVQKGFLFVAIRGNKLDGRSFIEEAAKKGASAVVVDSDGNQAENILPCVRVPECRSAASKLAAAFYGEPSKHFPVIGITGTNGKTTCSYLIEHLLQQENKKPGVIGTINYRFGGKEIPAVETTPGPMVLQYILSEMVRSGCTHAAMEVSSHALDQERAAGIGFSYALFTNLTQDHLDYHGSLEKYFECKAKLFLGLSAKSTAVVNSDDVWGKKLLARLKCRTLTYGIEPDCELRAENIVPRITATEFDLNWKGQSLRVELPLVGRHNIYNALGAVGILLAMGFSIENTVQNLKSFKGVPGRLEPVLAGQNFTVLVDFAHTPDGLENVLRSLSMHKKKRLMLVFGCGGDRDKGKRPKMAEIASRYCDKVYVTSDNPRSENPAVIADEVKTGFPKSFNNYTVVLDRKKALRRALMDAREGDIVLLAGKGHERMQVIGNEAIPFSDREEAERILSGR